MCVGGWKPSRGVRPRHTRPKMFDKTRGATRGYVPIQEACSLSPQIQNTKHTTHASILATFWRHHHDPRNQQDVVVDTGGHRRSRPGTTFHKKYIRWYNMSTPPPLPYVPLLYCSAQTPLKTNGIISLHMDGQGCERRRKKRARTNFAQGGEKPRRQNTSTEQHFTGILRQAFAGQPNTARFPPRHYGAFVQYTPFAWNAPLRRTPALCTLCWSRGETGGRERAGPSSGRPKARLFIVPSSVCPASFYSSYPLQEGVPSSENESTGKTHRTNTPPPKHVTPSRSATSPPPIPPPPKKIITT